MGSEGEARAVASVQIDTTRVRVTRWSFAPGAATGHHRHEYDYVVVPASTGQLRVRSSSGESLHDLILGEAYARSAGVEHDVINASAHEIFFVEIELKEPA